MANALFEEQPKTTEQVRKEERDTRRRSDVEERVLRSRIPIEQQVAWSQYDVGRSATDAIRNLFGQRPESPAETNENDKGKVAEAMKGKQFGSDEWFEAGIEEAVKLGRLDMADKLLKRKQASDTAKAKAAKERQEEEKFKTDIKHVEEQIKSSEAERKKPENFWWLEKNKDGTTTVVEDAAVPGTDRYEDLINKPDAVQGAVPDKVRENFLNPVKELVQYYNSKSNEWKRVASGSKEEKALGPEWILIAGDVKYEDVKQEQGQPSVWGTNLGTSGTGTTTGGLESTTAKEVMDKSIATNDLLIADANGNIIRNTAAIEVIKKISEKQQAESGTGLSKDMRSRLERNEIDADRFLEWYYKITDKNKVTDSSLIDTMWEGVGSASVAAVTSGFAKNISSLLSEAGLPMDSIDALLGTPGGRIDKAKLTKAIGDMTAVAYARAVIGAEYRAGGEGALTKSAIEQARKILQVDAMSDTKDGFEAALTIAAGKISDVKSDSIGRRKKPLRDANQRTIRDYAKNNNLTLTLSKYPAKVGNIDIPKHKAGIEVYTLTHESGQEYIIDADLDSYNDTIRFIYAGGRI